MTWKQTVNRALARTEVDHRGQRRVDRKVGLRSFHQRLQIRIVARGFCSLCGIPMPQKFLDKEISDFNTGHIPIRIGEITLAHINTI